MTSPSVLLLFSYAFVSLSLVMAMAWLIWYRTRNSGWVDTIWTFGCGLIGAAGGLAAAEFTARSVVVAACALCWSARLGFYIAGRTRGISDDPRYAALIADWGDHATHHMFWLLQSQAWASVPLVLSIILAAANPEPLWRTQDGVAVLLIATAVLGEALADRQLQLFRKAPGNRAAICDRGLWRYSRHPNYFFEWLGWLAYPLLAIAPEYLWGFFALMAPASMYWLLAHVSGIPPLEEHMLKTRGEGYREYQKRTSAFFLRAPRGSL